MKKLILTLVGLLLAGCLATENHKVEITSRGIAPTTSNQVWWRTPYRADRSADNPWDMFVPQPVDEEDEVEYFEDKVIKWPKTMPPARPTHTNDGLEEAKQRASERAAAREAAIKKILKALENAPAPAPEEEYLEAF